MSINILLNNHASKKSKENKEYINAVLGGKFMAMNTYMRKEKRPRFLCQESRKLRENCA